MTEAEWLESNEPDVMFASLLRTGKHVRRLLTNRKRRLFICACCRHVPAFMNAEGSMGAVDVVERFADGLAERLELQKALSAHAVPTRLKHNDALSQMTPTNVERVRARMESLSLDGLAERQFQAALMRDIFGNPFRPVTFHPSWLTSTVVTLAQGIYEDRAFAGMPTLADALQDAGCDNEEVLNHCRGEGVHVRGCFVVDLVLGKK